MTKPGSSINHVIFGECIYLPELELKALHELIERNSMIAFQILNKHLNSKGFCISIDVIKDIKEKV